MVPAAALLVGMSAVTTVPSNATGFVDQRQTGPVPSLATDAAETTGPFDVKSARLIQRTTMLVWQVTTHRPWSTRIMQHHADRTVCITLDPAKAATPQQRICVRYDAGSPSRMRAIVQVLTASGTVIRTSSLAATVTRPSTSSFSVTFAPADIALTPGVVKWFTRSTYVDSGTCTVGCFDRAPDTGQTGMRVWHARVNGCTPTSPWLRLNLPTRERVVALTFDDGPTETTQGFISTLHRMHVRGTFFVIGRQARANPSVVRRELAMGNIVGNHSFTHRYMTKNTAVARAELTRTNAVIKAATGYTPCLYRPPYGARGAGILRLATRLRMDTILWDVDPRDWSHPPSSEIRDHVLRHVHPGSIVLMHDGAGGRRATLAALPDIIRTLRSRGYRMVTIPELFHIAPTYTYTRT